MNARHIISHRLFAAAITDRLQSQSDLDNERSPMRESPSGSDNSKELRAADAETGGTSVVALAG